MIPCIVLPSPFPRYFCWDEVVSALKYVCSKEADVFRNIAHVTKVFAQRVGSKFRIIYRVFYKENNDWYMEEACIQVPESEVPEWAKAGVDESEVDVTDKYQRELQLTL